MRQLPLQQKASSVTHAAPHMKQAYRCGSARGLHAPHAAIASALTFKDMELTYAAKDPRSTTRGYMSHALHWRHPKRMAVVRAVELRPFPMQRDDPSHV
jgi:hypothetical protein